MKNKKIVKSIICLVLSASMSFIPITVKAEKDYDDEEIWAEIQTWDSYTEEKPREVWGLGDALKHDLNELSSNPITAAIGQATVGKAKETALEKGVEKVGKKLNNPKGVKKTAGVIGAAKNEISGIQAAKSLVTDDFNVNRHAALNSVLGGVTALSAVANMVDPTGKNKVVQKAASIGDLIAAQIRNGNADNFIDNTPGLSQLFSYSLDAVCKLFGADGGADFEFWMQSLGSTLQDTIDLKNDIAQLMQEALSRQKVGRTVGAYKPVIYFYNAQGKDITVKFPHEELLTETIPEYNGRWAVTTNDSDRIINADGKEYPNLYYESITNPALFDTRKGFYINKEDRAGEFNNILSEYGFNELEIKEFIDFWDSKLGDEDYIMYPQYTDTVNIAMPIEVNPIPDTIVRMWFVFEQADNIDYKDAEIEPFMREGYTLIEWGGVILDE